MEITFLGGAREVGASCALLQVAGRRILIDGGMRPTAREAGSRLPDLRPLDAQPPEAIVVTHAHIDHTGALPHIAALYPAIPIYATESTHVLMEILLRDSVRIMEQEGLRPDGETPLYTAEQVDALLGRIITVEFDAPFAPLAGAPLQLTFLRAGHILGAALLDWQTPEGHLIWTGDISVVDQRTVKGLALDCLPKADIVVCEGTYGNRSHSNRREEERGLVQTVQEVIARNGRVLCPAFAVGRAQEITLILKAFRASGEVSPVPIYLDGMVRSVCDAYQRQSHDLHPNLQRFLLNARRPLFTDPSLHIYAVRAHDRASLVQQTRPAVIISSSGMLTGGASPLYAAELASHERDCLLFTGYQDEESPGAALLKAATGDTITLGDKSVSLQCQVARYNLSGHADAEQIVHAITKMSPRQLILVHGAPDSLEALGKRFPKLRVDIPPVGATITCERFAASGLLTPQPLAPRTAREPGESAEPMETLPEPALPDLWRLAHERSAERPWTAVELGKAYYGPAYRPALRAQINDLLQNATFYFRVQRLGAQLTYLPRTQAEVEARTANDLTPGMVVIVETPKSAAQLAVVLAPPQSGTVALVTETWKVGPHPLPAIQLVSTIERPDLLALPADEAKSALVAWRQELANAWVDLIRLWDEALATGKASIEYGALCAACNDSDHPDDQLALGLELLTRGTILFARNGASWSPRPAAPILQTQEGLQHHLNLLHAGAGAAVLAKERPAVLTGRSSWRHFEVEWLPEQEVGRVYQRLIALQ